MRRLRGTRSTPRRIQSRLRKEFGAPNAKFVCATPGPTEKGATGHDGMILDVQLAVDGNSGNAETYMNIGEGMGRAMVGLMGN